MTSAANYNRFTDEKAHIFRGKSRGEKLENQRNSDILNSNSDPFRGPMIFLKPDLESSDMVLSSHVDLNWLGSTHE